MKIYTKTGDNGTTSLVGGIRVSKCDPRLDAYGTIDELNSFIGLLRVEIQEEHTKEQLCRIQKQLFVVGGNLATDITKTELRAGTQLDVDEISNIEAEIDRIQTQTPPFKGFVLPGGNKISALCHVCRTVARRAEREMIRLEQYVSISADTKIYINRLSDYFFILAYLFDQEKYFF